MCFIDVLAEDEGEVFQVRKSYHSKRVMRMMDKERRRKRKEGHRDAGKADAAMASRSDSSQLSSMAANHGDGDGDGDGDGGGGIGSVQKIIDGERTFSNSHNLGASSSEHRKVIKSDNIQTEIRTDDFVVRLLLSSLYQFQFLFTLIKSINRFQLQNLRK